MTPKPREQSTDMKEEKVCIPPIPLEVCYAEDGPEGGLFYTPFYEGDHAWTESDGNLAESAFWYDVPDPWAGVPYDWCIHESDVHDFHMSTLDPPTVEVAPSALMLASPTLDVMLMLMLAGSAFVLGLGWGAK